MIPSMMYRPRSPKTTTSGIVATALAMVDRATWTVGVLGRQHHRWPEEVVQHREERKHAEHHRARPGDAHDHVPEQADRRAAVDAADLERFVGSGVMCR
jgi:hypothetical protein